MGRVGPSSCIPIQKRGLWGTEREASEAHCWWPVLSLCGVRTGLCKEEARGTEVWVPALQHHPGPHSKRRRLVGSLASCALPSTWAFSHFPHVLSYSPSSLFLLFQSFSSCPSIVIHPVYCFKQPWQSGRHLEPQTTGCNKLENSAIWGKFFIHSSS